MTDQPARGPDGQLLDASKIIWFNDADDSLAIRPGSRMQQGSSSFKHNLSAAAVPKYPLIFPGQRSRPVRATAGARLAAAIAGEKLDEFDNPVQPYRRHLAQSLKHKTPAKRKQPVKNDANTDVDDTDFTASSAEDGSDDPSDDTDISNEKR